MYNPINGCSTLIHLLIKYPILIISLGIVGAASFLGPHVKNTTRFQLENEKLLETSIMRIEEKYDGKYDEVKKWFESILETESGNRDVGVHPDGISHGPAGLTKLTVKDVFDKLVNCGYLGYDSPLHDPVLNRQIAYLYFLDLIHRFDSIEVAVVAYNYGPTRVSK